MNASRSKRIAAGSGTDVQDVNKLLKMHRQMSDMMKKLGRGKGGLGALFGWAAACRSPIRRCSSSCRRAASAACRAAAGGMPGGMPRPAGLPAACRKACPVSAAALSGFPGLGKKK